MAFLRRLFGLDPVSKSRRRWSDLQAERTVETQTGLLVRSRAERRIADVLDALGLEYEYEANLCDAAPDFYLPDFDLIIEYWGMQDREDPTRRRKIARYLEEGHNLIGIEKDSWWSLEEVLLRRLYRYDKSVFRRYQAVSQGSAAVRPSSQHTF